MLGNGRLEAKCQDGETRLGQIRGQMRKKVCSIAARDRDVMTSERLPRTGRRHDSRCNRSYLQKTSS